MVTVKLHEHYRPTRSYGTSEPGSLVPFAKGPGEKEASQSGKAEEPWLAPGR